MCPSDIQHDSCLDRIRAESVLRNLSEIATESSDVVVRRTRISIVSLSAADIIVKHFIFEELGSGGAAWPKLHCHQSLRQPR